MNKRWWYIPLILICCLPIAVELFVKPISAEEMQSERTKHVTEWVNQHIVTSITYIQDHRTNLCFAKYLAGHDEYTVGSVTLVPCESVKGMLLNP